MNLGDDSKGDKDPCPLQYCDFNPIDHTKMCPLYTSMLTRSCEQGIAPEELDLLLSDLETLLAAANRRMRLLESENKLLVDWSERKDKKVVRQKELEILNSLSNFKRGPGRTAAGEEIASKKQKLDDSKTAHVGAGRSKKVGSKTQARKSLKMIALRQVQRAKLTSRIDFGQPLNHTVLKLQWKT